MSLHQFGAYTDQFGIGPGCFYGQPGLFSILDTRCKLYLARKAAKSATHLVDKSAELLTDKCRFLASDGLITGYVPKKTEV
jgi:hypothetical protein